MSKASAHHVILAQTQYHVAFHDFLTVKNLSFIDQSANGGVAGEYVRAIFRTNRSVDIKGIDNHQVNNIGIGTVGGVVNTQKGPVIAIMHQYALLGRGASIHSPSQLEWYKNDVNNRSVHVPGGIQRLTILPPKLSGIPLSWTMSSLMNHNGEKTILQLLTSFLALHMMNLVNTVIALKLISMY
jgi:hypothetical protein